MKQFESFRASEMYCPKCRAVRAVRERLLLVTPHSEIHDCRCELCGESLASREVKEAAGGIVRGRSR